MATRIGILSFAHLHAEGYQANLKGISGVELVGFSHENQDEGRRFAEEYRLRWFPGHQELLAEGLDSRDALRNPSWLGFGLDPN